MSNPDMVDDDRFEKVRTDFYATLGLGIGPLGKKDSEKLTKLAKKAAVASDEADKAAHDKARKVAKNKVLYDDHRARTVATISALRDYTPTSDALISRLIDFTIEADRTLNADPQAFEAASKALHAQSIETALATADEAWGKAEAGARKVAEPAYDKVDKLRWDIAAARTDLTDAAADAFSQQVLDLERALLAPNLQSKDVAPVATKLEQLSSELSAEISNAEAACAAAETACSLATNALETIDAPDLLGAAVTEADRAVLQRMRTGADTVFGAREFGLARTQFDDLTLRANSVYAAGVGLRADWARVAPLLIEVRNKAQGLHERCTSPLVKAATAALTEQLDNLKQMKPGVNIAFEVAIAQLRGAVPALSEIEVGDIKFVRFTAERTAAAARMRLLDAAAEVAFQPLRAAVLAITGDKQNDLADRTFNDRLLKVRDEWSARLANAQDEATLDEPTAQTELTNIAQDLALAARDDALLARLIGNEALTVAQAAYAQALAAVQPMVAQLTNIDAMAGAKTLAALDAGRARLEAKTEPGAYTAAADEATRLGREAKLAAQAMLELVHYLQMRLKQLLDPLPGELEELSDAVQKMSNAAKQKPHASMHATLVTAAAGLRAMGKLSQVQLLNEAIDDAEKLKDDVAMSVAHATKGKIPDGGVALGFNVVNARLLGLLKKLNHIDVQTYATVSAFSAKEAHQALTKGLGSITLSALKVALDALTSAVEKIVSEAAAAKLAFKKFESADVAPVRARLEAEPFESAKSFVAAMKGRLKAVITNAQFEGGLANARTALQAITLELDAIIASGIDEAGAPRALAALESAAVGAERIKEIAKAKYEAEADVLKTQLKDVKGLDHEGLRQSLSEVMKAAEKGAGYEDARDQLHSIRTRLASLAQNPQGIAVHVRKQLPAVNRRYKAAVTAYWNGLDAIGTAINALLPSDLSSKAKESVQSGLREVRVLYNPAVFDRPLVQVTNEGTSTTERSGARETAMRDTRRLAAYLTDDFRLQTLADTPFHAPMRGLLSELRLALLDLENNLLVSL